MNVFVVYCHPSSESFTYKVKEQFVKGLEAVGHSYEISDLYKMNFNSVFSEQEYLREAFYKLEAPIPDDVRIEQSKINNADAIVFIYPDFWTDAPAMLGGWFQRVWTYGYAYGDAPTMKKLEKALFLVTMGGKLSDKKRQIQVEAMKTVMIGDRIADRAKETEMIVFDEMTRGYGNDGHRDENEVIFLKKAYELGLNM
ncbi:MAG: NAD(P)H-dependent oxidoreductase [Oscillospiraceae bacterium]|nr:NAD(P)H-dependent oxidoreductase [Oscillospiraceae bacterium]